jgi:hypothetical protein
VHENNTFNVTNTATLAYGARQNTDFNLHGCMDQAETTLGNIQAEIARDVSEPHAYPMESDSKGTNSSKEEEDAALNTQVFVFRSEYHTILLCHRYIQVVSGEKHIQQCQNVCPSSLITSNVLPQLLLLAPLGKELTCHTSFNQQYLQRN